MAAAPANTNGAVNESVRVLPIFSQFLPNLSNSLLLFSNSALNFSSSNAKVYNSRPKSNIILLPIYRVLIVVYFSLLLFQLISIAPSI